MVVRNASMMLPSRRESPINKTNNLDKLELNSSFHSEKLKPIDLQERRDGASQRETIRVEADETHSCTTLCNTAQSRAGASPQYYPTRAVNNLEVGFRSFFILVGNGLKNDS